MSQFKKPFIAEGWNLDNTENFPKAERLSADTETRTYYGNKVVDDELGYRLYKKFGQKWVKQNLRIVPYALTLSDGKNFALFTDVDDFLQCVSALRAKVVVWYNAKFDFAIFDYYFLTNGWIDKTLQISNMQRYGKLPHGTYMSLNGAFGQRYQMTIWHKYVNKKYKENVHKFKMIDLCNVYGGGLKKNLESWDIEDFDGNKIRKLEMDYANDDIESGLQYMKNDVIGLWHLTDKVDKTLHSLTGFSFWDMNFITAGGLAKKELLKEMYGDSNFVNKKLFQADYPITIEEDKYCRDNHLYLGGKCVVNPYKKGIIQRNVYKYDSNSMYPDKMRNYRFPKGEKKIVSRETDGDYLRIYTIYNIYGKLKPGMIPVWQDPVTGDYVEVFHEIDKRMMWEEELNELKQWYDLSYIVLEIWEYEAEQIEGFVSFVDKFYNIKKTTKGPQREGAKLFLNSSYGKLAERVEKEKMVYELSEDGYVHMVSKGIEIDEKSMMSVIIGSRVTALARTDLMKTIREACENVKEEFLYCDTDSIHCLTNKLVSNDTDLGKYKDEGRYDYAIYLAPKTYLMYDGTHYLTHCKGVNVHVVEKELEKCKSFEQACQVFRANRNFKCLSSLGVKGGRALIYVDKVILNDKNNDKYANVDMDEMLEDDNVS